MLVGVSLFIIMVGTAIPAWRGDRSAAALLVLESVVWLYVDKLYEGPKLIRFGHHHGLVLADLVAFAALGLAALCVRRQRSAARVR